MPIRMRSPPRPRKVRFAGNMKRPEIARKRSPVAYASATTVQARLQLVGCGAVDLARASPQPQPPLDVAHNGAVVASQRTAELVSRPEVAEVRIPVGDVVHREARRRVDERQPDREVTAVAVQ